MQQERGRSPAAGIGDGLGFVEIAGSSEDLRGAPRGERQEIERPREADQAGKVAGRQARPAEVAWIEGEERRDMSAGGGPMT